MTTQVQSLQPAVKKSREELPGKAVSFSVVVPCYNEQRAIGDTVCRLREVLADYSDYELIIVIDGSTDGTAVLLQELQETDHELMVLAHERNQGYGAALKTGIRHARGELIVITDADGTYPHERIAEMLALAERYDMVVGARTAKDVNYSKLRSIPKVFLKAYASWIAGRRIPDLNSGMRVFRRQLAERFLHMLPDGFSFTTTITLAHLTNRYRVHYLPIGYAARVGKSKIQPIRDTLRFVQLIARMGMYFAPLRVLVPFCLVMLVGFLASLAYDVFVLGDLTEKTLLLLLFGMNTMFFALLADMIDKRSG